MQEKRSSCKSHAREVKSLLRWKSNARENLEERAGREEGDGERRNREKYRDIRNRETSIAHEREKRDSGREKGREEDAEEEGGARKKLTCDGKFLCRAIGRKKEGKNKRNSGEMRRGETRARCDAERERLKREREQEVEGKKREKTRSPLSRERVADNMHI